MNTHVKLNFFDYSFNSRALRLKKGGRQMITALAGGVGAAKFLQGLVKVYPEKETTIIVNTGDDIELYGLHISPDIDIVTYTLAGIVDEEKGWGIKNDTFHWLEMIQKYGYETWFKIGDKDLATNFYRTLLLKEGYSLTEITSKICHRLGLGIKILPMTDDRFQTKIVTAKGVMHFQEYMVKRGSQDKVTDVVFDGVEKAKSARGVIDAILEAKLIIICPSNPIVSIGPILSVKNVRKALKETRAKVVAISPIICGAPLKGPADKLMRGLGLEVSAYSVAKLYQDIIDIFIIDNMDQDEEEKIAKLGLKVVVTNTVMKTLQDKVKLAETTIKSAA
jgi:LPPG:FO 2-phospho-L-lactate transferase